MTEWFPISVLDKSELIYPRILAGLILRMLMCVHYLISLY